MDKTRRLPREAVELARAFAAGERAPVEPRPASTVVLLRGTVAGVEAYLIRRHLGMAFAGGMYAFPGGGVDPRDEDAATAWAGPSPADWAAMLRCEEALGRSLVCAAVRETFEESGVLLAGATPGTVVDDTTGPDWEADRAALVSRQLAFTDFLSRRGLVLRSDLLGYWAHWITPAFEPRRFDTRFFVAALPAGQLTRDVSGEADHVQWMRPADAVAGVDAETMRMLPPTYATLRDLSGLGSPWEALELAPRRRIEAILPRTVFDEAGAYLTVDAEPA